MLSHSRGYCFSIALVAFLVSGCNPRLSGENLLESRLDAPQGPASLSLKQERLDAYIKNNSRAPNGGFAGLAQVGSDQLTGEAIPLDFPYFDKDAEDVTLNLVNASIAQAAKAVLGDVLGLNYSLDGRAQGSITIQTSTPVSRTGLLELFEAALRDNGAVIVRGSSNYRIVPMTDAGRSTASIESGKSDLTTPGLRPFVITLRYVSADNMQQVLEPMLPQGMLLKTDQARNAILLSGTPREIQSIKQTIAVFDVDWMKGMSFALVPVKSTSPAAIVQDLDQVFETRKGPLKGILRFVPNSRLKSVLVISSRSKYLKDATRWINKLDVLAENSEAGLHVYHVQNRTASDLAKTLIAVLETGPGDQTVSDSRVAPRLSPATIASQNAEFGEFVESGPETPAAGVDVIPQETVPEMALGSSPRVKVVADDTNNALLIYSTLDEFERLTSILQEIDTVPNQVLIEAIIAEVSLDDDMRFGVRWFLGERDHGATFSDAVTGAVSSVFPGFSYFLKSNDVAFSLNAISSVTNVRVLSAPSLVVLDNRTATLQVGDQVPIVTQSAKSTSSGDAPIVTNVELMDTGVILRVTPRVNDSGLVTLDIEQEVSSVTKTTTSGIDSPTIRQRKLRTSVVVSDAEALALGGLIQERETTGKSKVPVLGDVPLLGAAFRQKTEAVSRTELIIFIRPRVIRDLVEARQVTEEFRKQLSVQAPRVRRDEPTPGSELVRILN